MSLLTPLLAVVFLICQLYTIYLSFKEKWLLSIATVGRFCVIPLLAGLALIRPDGWQIYAYSSVSILVSWAIIAALLTAPRTIFNKRKKRLELQVQKNQGNLGVK